MGIYDHKTIEKKWQEIWREENIFEIKDKDPGRENLFLLVEFPYPSGNLHIGHWYAFAVPDIFARAKAMQGSNVLFPIGFDAFGLPAENAAIKRQVNPREWTYQNIDYMRQQLRSMGSSFDWSRELATCDPGYYKWTQWLFLKFYEAGLVYQSLTKVNWCPSCKTVLANEQVAAGKCERCDSDVEQKDMKQWQLRITDYAEKLLDGLDGLDWPDEIKESQRNWIGKSQGAHVLFKIKNSDQAVKVFTTRPDTLFGATYMVLAPENNLVQELKGRIENWSDAEAYIKDAGHKTELERLEEAKEKTGVELKGIKAVNPVNDEEIPVYIADYVLMGYGTGAIMAVPAHDERDFEFAKKFNIPIRQVVKGGNKDEVFTGEGVAVNSGEFDGLSTVEFKEKIIQWLVQHKAGGRAINYRLRDWLVSRQRYWGCPIPVIHCQECGVVPVGEADLPVVLPEIQDFLPRDDGKSPLAKAQGWVEAKCPKCGKQAERETDTLDTFVDSSWYFLRYTDPENPDKFADSKKVKSWLPIDFYSGGAEHTTMHLLYSRFWIKVMYDLKLVDFIEPYTVRMNRGLILGPDGQKMSKSKGNVVDPDDYIDKLGADTMRMYLAFIGPYNEVGAYPWDLQGIQGIRKFLDRVWRLQQRANPGFVDSKPVSQLLHQTVKKVTEDIDKMKFNTAISQLMILVNLLEKQDQVSHESYKLLLLLLSPFTPHLAEELWQLMGQDGLVSTQAWPKFDAELAKKDEIELVVQVNGKLRDRIKVLADISQAEAEKLALSLDKVKAQLGGKEPKKVIYVPGRLVNIVV